MTDRVPVMWHGYQIGWATPGRFDVEEQSQELLDVVLFSEDQMPEEAKTIVKLINKDILKGLSIG